jgi:hypothetical protein
MVLVGIAIDQKAPGQNLLSRPRRAVSLDIAPKRRSTRIDLDVLRASQMQSEPHRVPADFSLRVVEDPKGFRLAI